MLFKINAINFIPRLEQSIDINRVLYAILKIMAICFFISVNGYAASSVIFAASERVPYIGHQLPQKGYVAELVTAAFKRQGYNVTIEFYPLARAYKLASEGKVDGVLPIFKDMPLEKNNELVFSSPFPGDKIGFLKKKSLKFSYTQQDIADVNKFTELLKPYQLGVVRGGVSLPFPDALLTNQQSVTDDLQNIDKLAFGRIQLALIDKYTAADLLVGKRPHFIGNFDFVMPPLAERNFFIGFSQKNKNYALLREAFNIGLQKIIADGTLQKILKKHGLFMPLTNKKEKKVLTIGTVDNNDMKVMQELSKKFEKEHPDIYLDWRILDENTLRLRLLSDLAISDGQFDIMTIGTYETPIWAKKQWLTVLEPTHSYEINDILPAVKSGFSYENKLYALPFYAESSMMFYRKDLFLKAGIRLPKQLKYSDVMEYAAKLHDPQHSIYGICLRAKPGWGENMAFLTTLVNAFGGRWFNEAWYPELDSLAWEKAIGFYKTIMLRYGPPSPEYNGFNENLTLFLNGRCAMWIDATVAAGMLFDPKHSRIANELGYVAAPIEVTEKGSAWLWGWGLAVPLSSTHKKEALEFISWATSKGYINQVATNYGWLAVPPGTRISTYQNKNYMNVAPFSKFVLNAIDHADIKNSTLKPKPYTGIQYVSIPEFPAIGEQVGMQILKALKGEQSVKDALRISQHITLDQMKKSGYIK